MVLATTVSSVLMPVGPDRFHDPLAGMMSHPLSAVTLIAYSAMLGAAGYFTWHSRRRGGPLMWVILINWGVGVFLYVWFNPYEPFLWLLEFLPLLIVVLANAFKDRGRRVWSAVAVVTVLVALHNTVFFYAAYR
jgi:hypothetical protein